VSLFCLIHGSSQNEQGWKLLIPELENRGHQVLTVTLPANEPRAGAMLYADAIVQALDKADCDIGDAVLVAHSASGMFLPIAAARRPINHMVFLAALIPKPGTSIMEQYRAHPEMLNAEWVGKNPMDDDVARRFLFHDCAPDVTDWALTTRELMYAREAMTEVCPLEIWPKVNSSYVVCAEDRTISPSWSRRTAREQLGVEPLELPGGHCPFVSRPAALAEVLARIPLQPAILANV
jgi:pimeloyl-ACP methyl ester carboxylesterase